MKSAVFEYKVSFGSGEHKVSKGSSKLSNAEEFITFWWLFKMFGNGSEKLYTFPFRKWKQQTLIPHRHLSSIFVKVFDNPVMEGIQ